MAFKNKLKQFLKTFDLFAHNVSFRYADQPAYQSVTGGACSIIMIIAFIIIFTGTALNTLNKIHITSNTKYVDDIDPSYFKMGTDTFMFAVGFTGINMNEGERWFDVYMQFRHYDSINNVYTKTEVPLVPCVRDVWASIDQNLTNMYDRLQFDDWLCPQNGTQLELQGKYTSQVFKFYKVAVKKCDPDLDPTRPCVNESVIQNYLDEQQTFNFNFYFVNMILNPNSHQYLTYYLDDLNYFPFSPHSGVNANLFLSTYNITTDQSILPWEDLKYDKGGIVQNTAQLLNYEVRQDEYLKMYLRKSSSSLEIERSFKKADDTLSYIGGLFSAILSVLILMSLYNEFSYELDIAANLYKYSKTDQIQSEGFHFFVFLGYLIYLIFQKVGIILPWGSMAKYHHSLEEIRKQMDIRLVMKKILYSERMGYVLLEEHQAKILHLQEPLSLKEAEDIRKQYRMYEALIKFYEKPVANLSTTLQSLMTQTQEIPDENTKSSVSKSKISPENRDTTKRDKQPDKIDNILDVMKRYLKKLKQEHKEGDNISSRILLRCDGKLFAFLSEIPEQLMQKTQYQRKLNLIQKEIDPEEEISNEEPRLKKRNSIQ